MSTTGCPRAAMSPRNGTRKECRQGGDKLPSVRTTLGQSECAHLLTMADEYDWLAARAEAKKRETEENQRPTRGSR